MDNMFASPQFRLAIAREYLDERSHNRQTGQRTPRYGLDTYEKIISTVFQRCSSMPYTSGT